MTNRCIVEVKDETRAGPGEAELSARLLERKGGVAQRLAIADWWRGGYLVADWIINYQIGAGTPTTHCHAPSFSLPLTRSHNATPLSFVLFGSPMKTHLLAKMLCLQAEGWIPMLDQAKTISNCQHFTNTLTTLCKLCGGRS